MKRIAIITLILALTVSSGAIAYYFSKLPSEPKPEDTPVIPAPEPGPEVPSTNPTRSENSSVTQSTNSITVDLPVQLPIQTYEDKASFQKNANATLGNWTAKTEYTPTSWNPSTQVQLDMSLSFSDELYTAFRPPLMNAINYVCVLVTAERDFDPQGNQRGPWNEQMSTILTPAGLPIEGGGSAAISRLNGYTQTTPVDVVIETPIVNFTPNGTGWWTGSISTSFELPSDLPPGIYRLRLDFGFKSGTKRLSFNGEALGLRPKDLNSISCAYSPPIAASGTDVNGTWVDGFEIQRRSYWVILRDYNSNGYRGVIAKEDQKKVAISPRNLIHDEIILPRFDSKRNAISYNLEPNFLFDNINSQRNIPWRYNSGEWSVRITLPNGTIQNLGTAKFAARRGTGATTNNVKFTSWKPPFYGNYTIEANGWIEDLWGNRYQGGGTYTFWIAERLTLATATFQGQAYNVGNRYGRDLAFNPPVPADVTIKASLFANSDPNNVTTVVSTGKATTGGVFTTAQGMKPLLLNTPGEYFATVTATYWDSQGTLWVCAMRHAGVVYPMDSTIEAHGKKISLPGGKLADRGEQQWEGYTAENGIQVLDHVNFPYNAYDVLLIASDGNASNKIEPVLTYYVKGSNATYDSALKNVGRSNLQIKTSNGLSPEMFPEYITDMQYYYGSAPRAGFNSRFIIAHDNIRAPYWPTSPNNFGGEIGASANGDLPGDIYRFLGGVVLRNKNQAPKYAGYQASGFILPKGSNNNRVIGPGDEDLPSPDGQPARFFLVSVRPGMVYQVGNTFGAVLQIDPVVPCDVQFTLNAPDNTTRIATGKGDQYGYFVATDKWPLDQAGVWTYKVNATYNGYSGKVPGLPEIGGWIFVLENTTASTEGISLQMPEIQTFSPTAGLNITGQTTASKVYCAVIIPGAVLEQVIIPVENGKFLYSFDPSRMAEKIQTYDIINIVNGKPEIGRVVHITFFTEENGTDGLFHLFSRVVLRGTTAIYVKND
ncbi:MAG TPA: hypothetical protein VF893_05085 [Candidatus Bathyarchaeia archaeon]